MSDLAINGGSPIFGGVLPKWPMYSDDEIQSVVEILRSGKVNYWTGTITKKFEDDFAKYHSMKHGIALANGTLALELALIGLGVGPGDEVVTTCRTFIASASCIVRVGATPILADIDLNSQNVTVETIKKVVTPKTKALIVVHLAGWPCSMPEIMSFANERGIKVVEDCAQAHGAKISGKLVGSFAHMAAFSFCQDKIMSTGGEGGMLLTNDTEAYEKMWAFKDHGKSYEAIYRRTHPPGFRWLHESFGTNWRFTEMQSAIGLHQLEKLESWVAKRRLLAYKIIEGLSGINVLRVPVPPANFFHSYYRVYAFLDVSRLRPGVTREDILYAIHAEGFPAFVGSCGEIYMEKAFKESPFSVDERFLNAKELTEQSLAFLVHPTLDLEYCDGLVSAVKKVISFYTLQQV